MTNIVTLVGNVTRDPDTRTTSGGKNIVTLSVVTSRPKRGEDGKSMKDNRGYTVTEDEFHRITCFNGLGKAVALNSFKGQKVTVVGRIHYSQYEKGGTTHLGVEIIADQVDFHSFRARTGGQRSDQDSDDSATD